MSEPTQPSYMVSTTRQLLLVSVVVYGFGTFLLMWKGAITTLDPLQWLINILLPLYAVRKGVEAGKNGHA